MEPFFIWLYSGIAISTLCLVFTAFVVFWYTKTKWKVLKYKLYRITHFTVSYCCLNTFLAFFSLIILLIDTSFCTWYIILIYGLADATNPLSINLSVFVGIHRLKCIQSQFMDKQIKLFLTRMGYCTLLITVISTGISIFGATTYSLDENRPHCPWINWYIILHNLGVLLADIMNTVGSAVLINETKKLKATLHESQEQFNLKRDEEKNRLEGSVLHRMRSFSFFDQSHASTFTTNSKKKTKLEEQQHQKQPPPPQHIVLGEKLSNQNPITPSTPPLQINSMSSGLVYQKARDDSYIEKVRIMCKYMIINSICSSLIYKPLIVVEFIRASNIVTHMSVRQQNSYIGFMLFLQAAVYSIDNCVTCFCTYKMNQPIPPTIDSKKSSNTSQKSSLSPSTDSNGIPTSKNNFLALSNRPNKGPSNLNSSSNVEIDLLEKPTSRDIIGYQVSVHFETGDESSTATGELNSDNALDITDFEVM